MRITNNMMTSKYTRQLSSLESAVNDSTTKVASGSALSKFSDNTTASVRAYKIRSTLGNVGSYQSNISHAGTYLTDAESAMNNVEDIYQYAMNKIIQGQNSTQSEEDRSIIASELRSLQEEMLSSLNTSASGTYLFGGTNTSSEPFTVDATTGKLAYNGYVLDTLTNTATIESLTEGSRYLDL